MTYTWDIADEAFAFLLVPSRTQIEKYVFDWILIEIHLLFYHKR